MKVFISWSGPVSNKVGQAIASWIPDLIQGTEVFLSSQDIPKGERNARSMWDALDGYDFGLSVVTAQNKNAPWIMFEAGAMMRFGSGRVVPLLCNLDRLDISSTPLNSFQCSSLARADMLAVADSMNGAAGSPLPTDKLSRSFDRWWPDLEEQLAAIDMSLGMNKPPEPLDQSDHFRRLEDGMTAMLKKIDRLSAVQNLGLYRPEPIIDDYISKGSGRTEGLLNLMKWARQSRPDSPVPDADDMKDWLVEQLKPEIIVKDSDDDK